MGLPGAGFITDPAGGFINWIKDKLGGGQQPAQPPATPSTPPPTPKEAANTVPYPNYQYAFSPLQAQVFLTHFLAPYLQQAQTPSMTDAAAKLGGMGFKVNPQQAQDLQKVEDTSAKALQNQFSSPMISLMTMMNQQQGQDKAMNQALRDNYITSLRTALQGTSASNPTDVISQLKDFVNSIGSSGGQ